jgi:hypothetical protein
MSSLFKELSNPSGNVLLITPLVFNAPHNLPEEDVEDFITRLRDLLKDYLKARGLSGSDEELDDLLEDKITEGLLLVQKGLSRLTYYGIQHALGHPEEHLSEE